MLKIRYLFFVLGMLLYSVVSFSAQVSIGINFPAYPELIIVPGYPVYYAPQLEANLFFYDGLYWVYQDDNWYASSWYNGPWWIVNPEAVPLFVLRIPVSYYRQPPSFFFGWQSDAPPRWGDHWGHDWEQRRNGWDRWTRSAAPAPAPLPAYQRNYSGDRYPRQVERQHELQKQKYHYQPRDPEARQHYQNQKQTQQRTSPHVQGNPSAPRLQSPLKSKDDAPRTSPASPQQGLQDHTGKQPPRETKPEKEQERGRDRNE